MDTIQEPDNKQNGVNNKKKYSIISLIILAVCLILVKLILYKDPNEKLKQEFDEKTKEYMEKDLENRQQEQNKKEQELKDKAQQDKDDYINRMIEGMKNEKKKK